MPNAALSASTLAQRLDKRARRLRIQAYLILVVIVAILVAGAVAFVLANQIVALGIPSHTAADQYAAALAADKQIKEQMAQIDAKRDAILDSSSIVKPIDDKIVQSRNEMIAYENPLIATCETTLDKKDNNEAFDPRVTSSPDRLGEFVIHIPLRTLYFPNQLAAKQCAEQFQVNSGNELNGRLTQLQTLNDNKQATINQFRNIKSAKIKPFDEQREELDEKQRELIPVIAETQQRATEERILGAPLGGSSVQQGTKLATTDWQQVIQSSITRVSSLAIMFFLVAILVPQYRYSIRMAAFYDARADSIGLAGQLQPLTHLQDLERTITAMTPNIDFGKAPTTPLDQLIEMIKAAKT